ncbi:hypothetical protein BpHYR1_028237 [Brachionus plicatilis]|uniref:Uncharacterized protein n=1 Tax=Brachionus plicatilis TaxID=10195 RepID=A0A3M7R669_BRAPC|nr:hypothetical protein BpHYR1_028237 [Brachionus plicatilis]
MFCLSCCCCCRCGASTVTSVSFPFHFFSNNSHAIDTLKINKWEKNLGVLLKHRLLDYETKIFTEIRPYKDHTNYLILSSACKTLLRSALIVDQSDTESSCKD